MNSEEDRTAGYIIPMDNNPQKENHSTEMESVNQNSDAPTTINIGKETMDKDIDEKNPLEPKDLVCQIDNNGPKELSAETKTGNTTLEETAISTSTMTSPLLPKNMEDVNKIATEFLDNNIQLATLINPLSASNPEQYYTVANFQSLCHDHRAISTLIQVIHAQLSSRRQAYTVEMKKRIQVEEMFKDLQYQLENSDKELTREIDLRNQLEKEFHKLKELATQITAKASHMAKLSVPESDAPAEAISGFLSDFKTNQLQMINFVNDLSSEDRELIQLDATLQSPDEEELLDPQAAVAAANKTLKLNGIQRRLTNSRQALLNSIHAIKKDKIQKEEEKKAVDEFQKIEGNHGMIGHCIPHRFDVIKVIAPSKCHLCSRVIWSGSSASKCVYCKYFAHAKCSAHVPPNCGLKDFDKLFNSTMETSNIKKGKEKNMKVNVKPDANTPEIPKTSKQPAVFGQALVETAENEKTDIPFIVSSSIRVIDAYGLTEQGIYRVPGKKGDIDRLKMHFNYGKPNLDVEAKEDVNSVAGALKLYFRELPEPLITFEAHEAIMAILQDHSVPQNEQVEGIKNSLLMFLPRQHWSTLKALILHLTKVVQNCEVNKMLASNLAVVFGPTIMRPRREGDLYLMSYQCSLVEMLVTRAHEFFDEY